MAPSNSMPWKGKEKTSYLHCDYLQTSVLCPIRPASELQDSEWDFSKSFASSARSQTFTTVILHISYVISKIFFKLPCSGLETKS